jgi:hypothetical protein
MKQFWLMVKGNIFPNGRRYWITLLTGSVRINLSGLFFKRRFSNRNKDLIKGLPTKNGEEPSLVAGGRCNIELRVVEGFEESCLLYDK